MVIDLDELEAHLARESQMGVARVFINRNAAVLMVNAIRAAQAVARVNDFHTQYTLSLALAPFASSDTQER